MARYFGDGDDVCVLDANGALTRPFVTAQAGEVATRGQDAHLGIQHSAAHFAVDGDTDGHLEVALASEQPARDAPAAGSPGRTSGHASPPTPTRATTSETFCASKLPQPVDPERLSASALPALPSLGQQCSRQLARGS